MTKEKEKIVSFLDKQIVELKNIGDTLLEKKTIWKEEFDLWDKTNRRVIRKLFGIDALNEYLECVKYEPRSLELGFSSEEWNSRIILGSFNVKIAYEDEKAKFWIRYSKLRNLFNAFKVEIEFFDDKDMKRFGKEFRKWWSIKGKTPVLDAEYGKEERIK